MTINITYTTDNLQFLSLFQKITGVSPIDCVIEDDKISFTGSSDLVIASVTLAAKEEEPIEEIDEDEEFIEGEEGAEDSETSSEEKKEDADSNKQEGSEG